MSEQLGGADVEVARPSPPGPFLLALGAALAAFAAILMLEFAALVIISELAETRLMPRGIGWLIFPILASVWGWRSIRSNAHKSAAASVRSQMQGGVKRREWRFIILGVAAWAAICVGYAVVEKPWGYRIDAGEVGSFLIWLLGPPLAVLALWRGVQWAANGE